MGGKSGIRRFSMILNTNRIRVEDRILRIKLIMLSVLMG
jgi:hypothetical protein